MKKKVLIFSCLFFITLSSLCQVKENEISVKNPKGKPELINFKETKINSSDKSVNAFLKKQFESKSDVEFILDINNSRVENNLESKKYKQYYKGIKVEFGIQNIISENGILKTISGKYVDIQNIEIKAKLSEKEALEYALKNIDAKEYMWENKSNEEFIKKEQNDPAASYYPKGELVIIEKNLFEENPTPRLAYKFNIYASNPVSRDYVYVDSDNGEILLKDAIIKHIQGIGDTKYSGQRTFETQQTGNQYKLRDYSRGNGIETYNMNRTANYASSTDFIDNDNNWSSAEYNNSNQDNAALDVHWGTEKTYDYFLYNHNRNSYNGNGAVLKNYVHANLIAMGYSSNANAFWNGSYMTYGDGSFPFEAITSIDVVGHEIGHAVCSSSANLIYSNESGAINEGLSDIWGSMIEFYSDPNKQNYLIGEELAIGTAFRSMSNPKSFSQPDTYNGTNWYTGTHDNGGVHTNSGVLNHWFYILAEGKSGTNDLGNLYNVVGIGKEKAAKIVYRAETVYFTSTTNYSQARTLTLQAANDLYGTNSLEAITVCQSWFAVGIGGGNCIPAQISGNNAICDVTTSNIYAVSNLLPNSNVVWNVTNNLTIINSTNSSIVIKALNINSGQATITANISGQIISKNIWIGHPLFNVQKTNETCGINRLVTLTINNMDTDTNHIYNYSFANLSTGITYVKISNNIFQFKIPKTYTQNYFNYSATATLGCSTGTYGNYVMFANCPTSLMEIDSMNTLMVEESNLYKVYPNPSNDIIYISLSNENNTTNTSTINAALYDLSGQIKDNISITNNTASLNVKNYKKGIYILKININGQIESHQIIIK